MRPPRPFSSGAFRFAFMLASCFALGSIGLLLTVSHLTDRYITEELTDGIETETDILKGEQNELGERELIHAIDRHARAVHDTSFRYLLIDQNGHALTGSLPRTSGVPGWQRITVTAQDEQGNHPVSLLAKGTRLTNGWLLVVAGDLQDSRDLAWQLRRFTALAGISISLLALIGGLAVGSLFLRRLDETNRSIHRIIHGNFSERLPRFGLSPEFNELTDNLNRMLERIEVLMEGLRQVSTDVAHDLRTPLTRLRHRLEAIQHDASADEIEARVEGCIDQIDDIIRIFSSLLRIATLENGKARANFENVDLSGLLVRLGAAFTPAIEDDGRSLIVTIAPDIAVLGDRDLIAQAVTNLLENAARHTPAGSTVRLDLQGAGDGHAARIVIEDNGPGVPQEDRAKVFRRFFRGERSRTTPGSGLGLALVSAIVQLHEGTIDLEDAGPGLRVVVGLPERP
ncbi:HAMP domain-containing sensor histidine kinase [Novosphingobium rosa]|uniref:HAMP domain-containing sensor histidine kinase n=1 Tax=Novosphingobium rosa TaxID=76978 RepID=UPI000835D8E9|nr:HAMP domain-containing sensor histidine kinase [Novosphingobium rosa]